MWLIIGLVIGAALLALVMQMRNKNFSIKWYEWLIGIVGMLLLLFTIQNSFALITEVQPTAAWMIWLIVGLPGLILLAVAWQLSVRRARAS
jgi:protein-S-isoprenylcysteine O-methyltransferase Ste14